jgi:excisionase family DNA binding protein
MNTTVIDHREQVLTTRQLAEHLQVTTRTLCEWRARKRIPFWKINDRLFRYKLTDVERALSK